MAYISADTYFFDGHIGLTDVGELWTNDANAADGSIATSATVSTNGGTSQYLLIEGTTAHQQV